MQESENTIREFHKPEVERLLFFKQLRNNRNKHISTLNRARLKGKDYSGAVVAYDKLINDKLRGA